MTKYWTVYQNALSTFLQYRLNLGLLVISHLVSLSGLMYLWIAVYQSGQTVGTYTLSQILLYYVLIAALRITIGDGVGMGFDVSDHINQGIVSNYLIKPFSYSLEQFFRLLGQMTINVWLIAPFLVALAFFFRQLVPLPSIRHGLQFLVSVSMAFIFYYLVYYLAALSAFWFHKGRHVVYGVLVMSSLLNGSLIPLDLFPDWLSSVNRFLPFRYLMFVPIQTFLGKIDHWFLTMLPAFLWMGVLSLLIALVWKQGVRKFEAVGR